VCCFSSGTVVDDSKTKDDSSEMKALKGEKKMKQRKSLSASAADEDDSVKMKQRKSLSASAADEDDSVKIKQSQSAASATDEDDSVKIKQSQSAASATDEDDSVKMKQSRSLSASATDEDDGRKRRRSQRLSVKQEEADDVKLSLKDAGDDIDLMKQLPVKTEPDSLKHAADKVLYICCSVPYLGPCLALLLGRPER